MSDHDLAEPGGRVRLYVEADLAAGRVAELDDGQAHYLRHVMRAENGNAVRLFNGRDGEWRAALALSGKRGASAIVETQTRPFAASPDLWLCFAPIKKTPADFIAQKATELGVSLLRPVLTRRTIVARVNVGRMRANTIEAAEQCDRLDVPDCTDPGPLPWLLRDWPADRALLFCDEAGAPPILDVLKAKGPGKWGALIGPEGGFDDEERAAIRALPQCLPASLGARLLRADTAALAALAVWQAALGGR